MSLKHKKFKNEKGFAIALALLMLVVMSLMGATLMVVAAGDHKRNSNIDTSQQAFYAAETGISEAKKWLAGQTSLNPQGDPNNNLRFCKVNLFPELSNAKAINNYTETKTLNQLISGDSDQNKKLSNFSYEYFITLTPDSNGMTQSAKTKSVAGSSGGDISAGTTYKSGGSSQATYYNIHSCGCDASANQCAAGKNNISVLQSTVTVTK